jgi:hypothetical protein
MATAKNIIVGAAKVYISYGTNSYRPNLNSSAVFPWNVNLGTGAPSTSASGQSTNQFLQSTASQYWRDFGFTSTGVDVSYEPGYSDVVVDQLLDAARLFQQSLKVIIKTELDEGTFENMNIVWGQQEQFVNVGSAASTTVAAISNSGALATASGTPAVTQIVMAAGALGIQPVERSLVFVGNAPGTYGTVQSTYPTASAGSTTVGTVSDSSSLRKKERVYVARRIIQEQTTAHALKRDAATVFPVSFRALPDTDGVASGGTATAAADITAGTEYGFIIDRVYGLS